MGQHILRKRKLLPFNYCSFATGIGIILLQKSYTLAVIRSNELFFLMMENVWFSLMNIEGFILNTLIINLLK